MHIEFVRENHAHVGRGRSITAKHHIGITPTIHGIIHARGRGCHIKKARSRWCACHYLGEVVIALPTNVMRHNPVTPASINGNIYFRYESIYTFFARAHSVWYRHQYPYLETYLVKLSATSPPILQWQRYDFIINISPENHSCGYDQSSMHKRAINLQSAFSKCPTRLETKRDNIQKLKNNAHVSFIHVAFVK